MVLLCLLLLVARLPVSMSASLIPRLGRVLILGSNAVTKPDSFLLPRMEDCVDHVGSGKYVSTFDLLKGYWHVPLSDRAREICSFVTPIWFVFIYSYAVWAEQCSGYLSKIDE